MKTNKKQLKRILTFITFIIGIVFFLYEIVNYIQVEFLSADISQNEQEAGYSKVIRVVDGDTVVVLRNSTEEKLRLIGINTPETVDPRKEVECFGREASDKAKELLDDQYVKVTTDPSQGERDRYNRLLAYVFLEDGTNFNEQMIREGYAYEYTYSKPYQYQNLFKEAQKEAQEARRGLWGADCKTE